MAQARQIFDDSFLSIRAKLIEIAAVLDRIDRATAQADTAPAKPDDNVDSDPRRQRIDEAIGMLLRTGTQQGERAAALQQLFSR
ncbi:MAG TPA: hypothetical protein DDZ51_06775, partial [Planctomycetaceae bacterium]|nr:hypothetical protein [Planctomycetaceae bacterium]